MRSAASSRRTACLSATTALGSVGLAAGGSASPLLAASMTHDDAALGLPLGIVVTGSAIGALLISRRSAQGGRLASLGTGYVIGALGALVVVTGAAGAGFPVVLAGCLLLGGANAAVFLTRYAAAEQAPDGGRGRAVGSVLFATTLGAVAGPNLLAPTGHLAVGLGLPALTGLYLLAVPAFAAAAAVLLRIEERRPAPLPAGRAARPDSRLLRRGPAPVALAVLASANLVMVAIMAVAPVRMIAAGRDLTFVGAMVSAHIAGMFAPSPVSGRLADRLGPRPVCAAGLLLLAAAAVAGSIGAFSGEATTAAFLTTVGIGWNAAVVGGSSLLVAALPSDLRARGEGIGEVAMGLAAAAGAPGAGLVAALGGFLTLALGCALAALAGLAVLAAGLRPRATAPAPAGFPRVSGTTLPGADARHRIDPDRNS